MAAKMIPAPARVQVEKIPDRVKRHCTSLHIIKVLNRQIVWCRLSRLSALQRLFTLHDTTSPWEHGPFSQVLKWHNLAQLHKCNMCKAHNGSRTCNLTQPLCTPWHLSAATLFTPLLLSRGIPSRCLVGKNIFPKASLTWHPSADAKRARGGAMGSCPSSNVSRGNQTIGSSLPRRWILQSRCPGQCRWTDGVQSSVLLVCPNPPRAIHLGLDSGTPYTHSEITRRGQALPSVWACWAEEGIDSAITGNRQGQLRVYLDEKPIFRYKARHFQRWQSTLGRWVEGGHQATLFTKINEARLKNSNKVSSHQTDQDDDVQR